MFSNKVIKVICSDNSILVPEFLINQWETYKGLVINDEVAIEYTSEEINKLLVLQVALTHDFSMIHFEFIVYKIAHFVGVMNILNYTASNVTRLKKEAFQQFFEPWNIEQIEIAAYKCCSEIVIKKILDLFLLGHVKLEKCYIQASRQIYEQKCEEDIQIQYCCDEKVTRKYFPMAKALCISPTENVRLSEILKDYILNERYKVHKYDENVKTMIHVDKKNYFYSEMLERAVNVDPSFLRTLLVNSISAIDSQGNQCILTTHKFLGNYNSEEGTFESNVFFVAYKDRNKIHSMEWKNIVDFKPNPYYTELKIILSKEFYE